MSIRDRLTSTWNLVNSPVAGARKIAQAELEARVKNLRAAVRLPTRDDLATLRARVEKLAAQVEQSARAKLSKPKHS